MKARAFCSLAVMVAVVLICGSAHALIDSEITRRTLEKLQGVLVLVDKTKEEVVKDSFSREVLEATKMKLRQAGLRIFSAEESYKEPRSGLFHILLTIRKGAKDTYVCYIKVELAQEVRLVRSPDVKAIAITWSTESLFLGMTLNDVREEMLNYVGKFIDAYLSVNPKK